MAFSEVCPILYKLGVTSSLLLNVAEDSDNGADFSTLDVPWVTNEVIIELYHFMN